MKLSVSLSDQDVAALDHYIAQVFAFQVLLPAEETGLRIDSKAQAEQVRAVSVDRVGAAIGRLNVRAMAELDQALRPHLQL